MCLLRLCCAVLHPRREMRDGKLAAAQAANIQQRYEDNYYGGYLGIVPPLMAMRVVRMAGRL